MATNKDDLNFYDAKELADIQTFIKQGWNVDGEYAPGFTFLMHAADQGLLKTVEFLLKSGANPNLQSPDGTTPLMFAEQNGHAEIVKLLIANGADVNAGNENTPALEIAKENHHANVVKIFKKTRHIEWDEKVEDFKMGDKERHNKAKLLDSENYSHLKQQQYGGNYTLEDLQSIKEKNINNLSAVVLIESSFSEEKLPHTQDTLKKVKAYVIDSGTIYTSQGKTLTLEVPLSNAEADYIQLRNKKIKEVSKLKEHIGLEDDEGIGDPLDRLKEQLVNKVLSKLDEVKADSKKQKLSNMLLTDILSSEKSVPATNSENKPQQSHASNTKKK